MRHVRLGLSTSFVLVLLACGGKVLTATGGTDDGGLIDATNPAWVPDAKTTIADAAREADVLVFPDVFVDDTPTAKLEVISVGNVFGGVPVTFNIPPNALGFHVSAQAAVPSTFFSVKNIVAPSGFLVYTDGVPWNGTVDTGRTFFGDFSAAGVPQSAHAEAMPPAAGDWSASLTEAGNITVSYQTTPDGLFHGGLLDVNFDIPDGVELGSSLKPSTAALAPVDPAVQDRVDAFFNAVKALYGLSRGRVKYIALPASMVAIQQDAELQDAWRATVATDTGRGAHIIFSGPADQWWGIAGGIPGVANRTGTDQSGLILASIPTAVAADEGFVLAHELGHFLGLNHTTEFNDAGADPLDDTPSCPGVDVSNLKSCPDLTNVMFPAGATSSPVVTSPLQQKVVQGSPVYRAFLSGEPPIAGKAMVPPIQWRRIFGHEATPLTRGEELVAAHFCAHTPRHRVSDPAARAALGQTAQNAKLPRFARGIATELLAR